MARLRTGEGGAREATAQAEAAGGDARPGLRARADRETDDGCTERGHVATICDGAETLGPGFGTTVLSRVDVAISVFSMAVFFATDRNAFVGTCI